MPDEFKFPSPGSYQPSQNNQPQEGTPRMPEPQPFGQPQPFTAPVEAPEPQPLPTREFPSQPPVRPRKRSHKPLILLLCLVLILALAAGACFVWPGFLKKQKDDTHPLERTLRAVLGQNEICRYFLEGDASASGLDLNVNNIGQLMSTITGEPTYTMFAGNADLNLTIAPKSQEGSAALDLSFMGIALKASLSYDKDGVTLNIPELLGEDNYHIAFEDLDQQLSGSVFNPNSGSAYALDQASYNQLMQALTSFQRTRASLSEEKPSLKDDFKARLEEKGLAREFTLSEGEISLNGETLPVTIQSLPLSSADLLGYIDVVEAMAGERLGLLSSVGGNVDLSSVFSSLREQINNDHIAAILEMDVYKNYVVRMQAHLYDASNPLSRAIDVVAEFGKDPASTDHVSVIISPGQGAAFTLDYRVTTNTEASFSSVLSLSNAYQRSADSLAFDWNKQSGDFTLKLTNAGSYAIDITYDTFYTLTGKIQIEKSVLSVSPTLFLEQEAPAGKPLQASEISSFDLSSLSLSLDCSAKVSKISGKSKDFFSLKEEEMNDLLSHIQSSALGPILFKNLPGSSGGN